MPDGFCGIVRDGTLIVPDWGGRPDRIHYPIQFYDVLFALQVMAELGRIGDPRCADALALLESKRLADGGFPLEEPNARHRRSGGQPTQLRRMGPIRRPAKQRLGHPGRDGSDTRAEESNSLAAVGRDVPIWLSQLPSCRTSYDCHVETGIALPPL